MARYPLLARILHSEETRTACRPPAHSKTSKAKASCAHPARIKGAALFERRTKSDRSLFLRQNDYWTIRYHGQTVLLKSTRGLHYLAILLRDPRREFHVRELLSQPIATSTPPTITAKGRPTGRLYAGVPVLDARAKAEYERRISDLQEDLNQAERFNDLQRRAEVQSELQAIADHLARAVGLGAGTAGFPRTLNEHALP